MVSWLCTFHISLDRLKRLIYEAIYSLLQHISEHLNHYACDTFNDSSVTLITIIINKIICLCLEGILQHSLTGLVQKNYRKTSFCARLLVKYGDCQLLTSMDFI